MVPPERRGHGQLPLLFRRPLMKRRTDLVRARPVNAQSLVPICVHELRVATLK